MAERDYPVTHPGACDYDGTPQVETRSGFERDYPADRPERGGQGQPVPTEAGSHVPRDGFKHLHGLPGNTLAEREAAFSALPRAEQKARAKSETTGNTPV